MRHCPGFKELIPIRGYNYIHISYYNKIYITALKAHCLGAGCKVSPYRERSLPMSYILLNK